LHAICAQYNSFKRILFNQLHLYKDNVHLFIVSALAKVPYLKDCAPETLMTIAYSMKNENIEADRLIFGPGECSSCMFLINTGVVEISTKMDSGTEFVLEKALRGTIINATSFLFEEPLELSAKTVSRVNMYVIDKLKFLSIAGRDKDLLRKLEKEINKQLENVFLLDVTSVRETITMPHGKPLVGAQALKGHTVSTILKNTVIGVILKNRENRKVPKLQDILR